MGHSSPTRYSTPKELASRTRSLWLDRGLSLLTGPSCHLKPPCTPGRGVWSARSDFGGASNHCTVQLKSICHVCLTLMLVFKEIPGEFGRSIRCMQLYGWVWVRYRCHMSGVCRKYAWPMGAFHPVLPPTAIEISTIEQEQELFNQSRLIAPISLLHNGINKTVCRAYTRSRQDAYY